MRPMQDVEKIGGPHISVYRTQEEFIGIIKELMESPRTFSLDLENHGGKKKSRQFEETLKAIS